MDKNIKEKLLFLLYFIFFFINSVIFIPRIDDIWLKSLGQTVNAMIYIRVFLLGIELGITLKNE